MNVNAPATQATRATQTTRATGSILNAERDEPERTRLPGTGIEVWEVVKTFIEVGCNWGHLRQAYPWLDEARLADALKVARIHSDAVLARIRADYAVLPEHLRPEWDLASFPCRC
jgi:uncharacterized protein (DUF433 family)